MMIEGAEPVPQYVTDLDAIVSNTEEAVASFAENWICLPRWVDGCEIMDTCRLRDALGLRATASYGDPLPAAVRQLVERHAFVWNELGGVRVFFLQSRDGVLSCDDGDDIEPIAWDDDDNIEEGEFV